MVVDLVPGDLTKPREESFRLASAAGDFVYHSNLGNADPGYSPFTTPGVVITNGMRLRLCEDGGRVGRIEVAE